MRSSIGARPPGTPTRWSRAFADPIALLRSIRTTPEPCGRANAYRSSGRLDRALADASEAVRLDPKDAKAFDNRGDVFVDKGQ